LSASDSALSFKISQNENRLPDPKPSLSDAHLLTDKQEVTRWRLSVAKLFAFRSVSVSAALLSSALLAACAPGQDDSASKKRAMAAYCPYVTSPRVHSNPMTVTGTAKYDYRIDGNGIIPNGTNAIVPTVPANGATTVFTLTINGTPRTSTCSSPCTLVKAVRGLVTDTPTGTIAAHGQSAVGYYRTSGSAAITLTGLSSNLSLVDARPIRYAEVRATSPSGEIMQCAETDANGNFSLSLPNDGAQYSVSVLSRSSNSSNTAYVMNNPTDNEPYVLTKTIQSTSGGSLTFRALATGSLEGGAFNIMDQIANAQSYIRTTTAGCDQAGMTNYYVGCQPFTVAPMVYTYWSPGISPGAYYGISGPISFYLNGDRELYILGGQNGDTTASDMDHFDNSVIIHEYGHFIEDQYGRPNSPGGSHNGNAIIDPRLAWGEGWANYFQAAVTGVPFYRDTKGYINCGTGCSAVVAFNEPLESGTTYTMHDQASLMGEGNFREFSVSRVLWNITKNVSGFSEIWTVMNGTNGMRSVSDTYKSIGRFHVIHSAISTSTWTAAQNAEKQRPNFTDYATRVSTTPGCSPASTAMAINVTAGDDGSFADSDQFNNNDFYFYNHPGGPLSISVDWGGGDQADLDLYLYKTGYTFGDSSSESMAAKDDTESVLSSGSAYISTNLNAGTYMINVMAYTGLYNSIGTKNTTYTLKIGGQVACPSAL
jgi:hypothetical protein